MVSSISTRSRTPVRASCLRDEREQALDDLVSHTVISPRMAQAEIDRYRTETMRLQ